MCQESPPRLLWLAAPLLAVAVCGCNRPASPPAPTLVSADRSSTGDPPDTAAKVTTEPQMAKATPAAPPPAAATWPPAGKGPAAETTEPARQQKADPPMMVDDRALWRFAPAHGSGYFKKLADGKWEEIGRDGQKMGVWEELARTPDYVEMYDPKRNYKTRLGAGKAWMASGRDSIRFGPSPGGNWERRVAGPEFAGPALRGPKDTVGPKKVEKDRAAGLDEDQVERLWLAFKDKFVFVDDGFVRVPELHDVGIESVLSDPEVGHAGLAGTCRVLKVKGPKDVIVCGKHTVMVGTVGGGRNPSYVDRDSAPVRLVGFPTDKLVDGMTWDGPKDGLFNVSIIGTTDAPIVGGGTRRIFLGVPTKQVREGLTKDQFRDLLRRGVDLGGLPGDEPVTAGKAGGTGVGPAPKGPGGEAGFYLPTTVGDTSVFQGTGASKDDEGTQVVTAVEKKDGAVLVTLRKEVVAKVMGVTSKFQVLEQHQVSERGVFQVAHGKQALDPSVCHLRLPAKERDTWTADVPVEGVAGPARITYTTGKAEVVEVPAGKFHAVRVEMVGKVGETTIRGTNWYAPGRGIVKTMIESPGSVKVVVLKSFTPGKDGRP